MRTGFMGAMTVIAAAAAAVVTVACTRVPAQGPPDPYRAPRTADGRPDLNGIWQAMNTANYDIQTHPARPALALIRAPSRSGIPGLVRATPVDLPAAPVRALGAAGGVPAGEGVVDGDEIPYQPWAAAKKKENSEHWLERDPEIKCYLPGVPRATYMPQPFQILQNSTAIFIAYQYAGATRNVYMKDPGPPPVDSWMGQSVGRWDGDTLVVDVKGFNDQTWFDRSGNFHSDKLHVTERYTRTSPDVISYEATIEDPQVFSRPWKIAMPIYRRLEKNAQLMDFKCVEFVEELLYGQWRKEPLPR
jgi:hypothetical protein